MAISLTGIPNHELLGRLKQFVAKEQTLTHRIILHLAELDRRRLYAELGYSSLYDYCVRGLKYSSASAQRRIKAARAMQRVPEVYDCLEKGSLSLGVIEVVADALTGKNARELIKNVCGKSREEACKIVAAYHPVPAFKLRDRIEPVVIRKPEQNSKYFRAEVQNEVGNSELQYRISFTAAEELKEKLERARELLFGAFGPADIETVLGKVLDEFIERRSPEGKAARRVERQRRKEEAQGKRLIASADKMQEAAEAIYEALPAAEKDPRRSRYISSALREKILERDGYQCTYVANDGTKCGCRHGLQIDHIEPFAFGGLTEPENLRAVCKAHNMLLARKIFGDDHIRRVIEKRKPDKDGRPTVIVPASDVLDPAEFWLFG